MKINTWDLTGFGGGYEATTQKMLWQGVKFLVDNNIKEIESKQLQNVYGIAINEGEIGKQFDEAMMKGIDDATGAMHQCATNHARYIAKNGYQRWYDELKEHRTEEKSFEYEFNEEIKGLTTN